MAIDGLCSDCMVLELETQSHRAVGQGLSFHLKSHSPWCSAHDPQAQPLWGPVLGSWSLGLEVVVHGSLPKGSLGLQFITLLAIFTLPLI